MSWFKIDDQFPTHPKVLRAGPDAAWLFVAGGCYCAKHLTDGLIPKCAVATLTNLRGVSRLASRLVEVGLWHEGVDDYEVHDYLDYNPTREQVEDERRKARERRANGGKRSGERRANVTNPDPARPGVPSEHAFADDFDRLWMNYPRKIDKQAAFKAYQARRREGAPPVLLEASVGYYAKSVAGVEARYVKHGKTFFAKDGPWVEWQHGPPAAELAAVIPGPRIPARPEAIYQMPASAPMCPTCESSVLACLCNR